MKLVETAIEAQDITSLISLLENIEDWHQRTELLHEIVLLLAELDKPDWIETLESRFSLSDDEVLEALRNANVTEAEILTFAMNRIQEIEREKTLSSSL